MKIILVFSAILLCCSAISDEEVDAKWREFQQVHGKSYRSAAEARQRQAIFKKSLEEIEQHNALYAEGKVTWTKGVNAFADLTDEEWLQDHTAPLAKIPRNTQLSHDRFPDEAPESLDWRQKGIVSQVRDQGKCKNPWAFVAIDHLESLYAKNKNVSVSLSIQQLLDCSDELFNYGCQYGDVDGAFLYFLHKGITTEKRYPYTGVPAKCKREGGRYGINTFYITKMGNETDLKLAVANIGTITIALHLTSGIRLYKSGIYAEPLCYGELNSWALLVGYGSENGTEYWTVKMAKGTSYGEEGYIRLIRNKPENCGVASQPVYGYF